jgi:Tfp pilus assembly protein PilO
VTDIREKIQNLSQREKLLVGGAVLFIVVLLFYFFIISPAQERSTLLNRLITQKEGDFTELLLLQERYQRLKASEDEIVERLSSEAGKTSPLTQLEQVARKAGLREQIEQMKPLAPVATPRYVVTPVQLRLKGAGLQEVVAYLYEIENAQVPFHIKQIKIKPTARAAGRLDVTLEILTFTLAGGR